MTWVHSQSTGNLDHDGAHVGSGYSGHGDGLNNPASQTAHDVGPLPQCTYSIGDPVDPPNHLGPLAMPLTPTSGDMFGRSGFFIHGDNSLHDHSASDGYIIPRPRHKAADRR